MLALQPTRGNLTDAFFRTTLTLFFLQIEKFGDPNGIVQFSEDALQERVYSEPTEEEGALDISLSVRRREGVMGNITVGRRQYFPILCLLWPELLKKFHLF